MNLLERIKKLVGRYNDEALFEVSSNSDGLLLIFPDEETPGRCENREVSPGLLNQYVHLRILEEEGIAQEIGQGFLIKTENAVRMSRELRLLFQMPMPWPGSFEVEVHGHSTKEDFNLQLVLLDGNGGKERHYSMTGPLLRLGPEEIYLPDEKQWLALSAVEKHRSLSSAEKSEYANLHAIHQLKKAQSQGLSIDLRHFNKFSTLQPDSISVGIDLDEDGNARLTPAFAGANVEEIDEAIPLLKSGKSKCLRLKDKIVLLDEERLNAVSEIISNREISKEEFKTFLNSPTAYINANSLNFDAGFSLRVHGVKEFTHAYFGNTDASDIEWFSATTLADNIFAPRKISDIITNEEDLEEIIKQIKDARETGADTCLAGGIVLDISDPPAVDEGIKEAKKKLEEGSLNLGDNGDDEPRDGKPGVIDIARNDAELEFGNEERIDDVLHKGRIDWSAYSIKPFDYQEKGIRWLFGLSANTSNLSGDDLGKYGCLLADDMGLGKTFMSLAAVNEWLKQSGRPGQEKRPVLVVAPLGLLQNWKDEIAKTFVESPFSSIITLRSEEDLGRFKIKGMGIETDIQEGVTDLEHIRYALKVGPSFASDRLDTPGSLVLTTYQTLRSYQFSLARVDWSFVIFDEAQNIKNPNALSTIAAKALKAHFKVIATGTPVENSLVDFWCLFDNAKPGHLGAFQDFREKYIKPILLCKDKAEADEAAEEVKLGVGKRLRNDAGVLMLRRIKEDQLEGLPKKRIYTGEKPAGSPVGYSGEEYSETLHCVMRDDQKKTYETIVALVAKKIQLGQGRGSILGGLHQLRDVSLHPGLMEGGEPPPPTSRKDAERTIRQSAKLEATVELLHEIKRRREKAIIFVVNRNLQAFLQMSLGYIFGAKVSIINGDTKTFSANSDVSTRKSKISEFERSKGFGVIIMSPIAAGTGLTITEANNVIHLERHWNPAKEAQATDRVYRIGQKKDVNVYLPVLHHPDPEITSYDQNLSKLLKSKSALKDAIMKPEEVDPDLMAAGLFGGGKSIDPGLPKTYRPEDLENFSWKTFEAFVAVLMEKHYDGKSTLTSEGADKGADIIVRGERNILIQVKHTKKRLSSGMPLREIYAAERPYSEAKKISFDQLLVVTNARKIAPHILKQAPTYKAEIIGYGKLEKLMKAHKVTEAEVLRKKLDERSKI